MIQRPSSNTRHSTPLQASLTECHTIPNLKLDQIFVRVCALFLSPHHPILAPAANHNGRSVHKHHGQVPHLPGRAGRNPEPELPRTAEAFPHRVEWRLECRPLQIHFDFIFWQFVQFQQTKYNVDFYKQELKNSAFPKITRNTTTTTVKPWDSAKGSALFEVMCSTVYLLLFVAKKKSGWDY